MENLQYKFRPLKRFIGFLGMLLPMLLILSLAIFEEKGPVLTSISGYYHFAPSAGIFVGILFTFGVILIYDNSYSSQKRFGNLITNIAGFCAIVTATVRCGNGIAGSIHLGAASIFFLLLSVICLFHFTKKTIDVQEGGLKKKSRNVIYIVCGSIILICIVVMFFKFRIGANWPRNTIFVFETIGLEAFGLAWLVKGRIDWKTFRKDITLVKIGKRLPDQKKVP